MIRAALYIVASAIIWLIEGFLFSYFLRFALWQTALMAFIYVALIAMAVLYLLRLARDNPPADFPAWRYLSLAPMLTVILGSFASLPILLLIAALGKV